VAPLVAAALSFGFGRARGPFWLAPNFDPEYCYLENGLLVATGHRTFHSDHPGAVLQLLCGAVIRGLHLAVGRGDVVEDTLRYPERYLAAINAGLAALFALALWAGGVALWLGSGRLLVAMTAQAAPLLLTRVPLELMRVSPEPLLLSLAFVFGVQVMLRGWGDDRPATGPVAMGVLAGVGLATKITFAPLLAVPLVVLRRWRGRFVMLVVAAATFAVFLVGVIWVPSHFFDFIGGIAGHTGRYGSGGEGFLTAGLFSARLSQLVLGLAVSEPVWLGVVAAAVAGLVGLAVSWRRLRGPARRDARVAIGFSSALVGQVLMVTKDPVTPHHYLIPALAVTGLAVVALARTFVSEPGAAARAVLGVLVVVALVSAVAHNRSMLAQLRSNRDQRAGGRQAISNLRSECRFVYSYRVSEPAFALGFGNGFAGKKFGQELSRLYPGLVGYNVWNHRYESFTGFPDDDRVGPGPLCLVIDRGSLGDVERDLVLEPIGPPGPEVVRRILARRPAAPR
jgi:hypothetical protein